MCLRGSIQAAPGGSFGYESHDGPEDKCLGPPEDPCEHPTLGDKFTHPTHLLDFCASGVHGPGALLLLPLVGHLMFLYLGLILVLVLVLVLVRHLQGRDRARGPCNAPRGVYPEGFPTSVESEWKGWGW